MAVQSGVLRPFAPDLIGEYLVITSLNEYFPFDTDVEWLLKHAWDDHPDELLDFLLRVQADFSKDIEVTGISWHTRMLCRLGSAIDDTKQHPSRDKYRTLMLILHAFQLYHMLIFIENILLILWERCKRHEPYLREKIVAENYQAIWDNYQAGNNKGGMLVLIERIEKVAASAPDNYGIFYVCTQMLRDIFSVKRRNMRIYAELRDLGLDFIDIPEVDHQIIERANQSLHSLKNPAG
jgi:hypothetical protein